MSLLKYGYLAQPRRDAAMKRLRQIPAISLGPGIALFLAFVGYTVFDVYRRGCDIKFGCLGNIQFAAFIAALMLACSATGHLLICLFFRDTVRLFHGWRLFGVVAALSLGQGAMFVLMERLLPGDSVVITMLAWAAISSGIALVVLSIVRRRRLGDSFKPTRGRGAA